MKIYYAHMYVFTLQDLVYYHFNLLKAYSRHQSTDKKHVETFYSVTN